MTNDRFMALYGQIAAPLIASWSGAIGAGVLRGEVTPEGSQIIVQEAQQAFENAIAEIPEDGIEVIGWAPGALPAIPVDISDFDITVGNTIEVTDETLLKMGLDPKAFPKHEGNGG